MNLAAAEARFVEAIEGQGVSGARLRVARIDVGVRAQFALRRLEERHHPNPSADDIAADMLSEFQYEVEGSP
jgi:hypothetical protein